MDPHPENWIPNWMLFGSLMETILVGVVVLVGLFLSSLPFSVFPSFFVCSDLSLASLLSLFHIVSLFSHHSLFHEVETTRGHD